MDGSSSGEGRCSSSSAEAVRAALLLSAAAEPSAPLTLRALRARIAAAPARPVLRAALRLLRRAPSRLPGSDTSGLLGPGRWVKRVVTLRGAASASGCFSQIKSVRREYVTFQRRFGVTLLVLSFFFFSFPLSARPCQDPAGFPFPPSCEQSARRRGTGVRTEPPPWRRCSGCPSPFSNAPTSS